MQFDELIEDMRSKLPPMDAETMENWKHYRSQAIARIVGANPSIDLDVLVQTLEDKLGYPASNDRNRIGIEVRRLLEASNPSAETPRADAKYDGHSANYGEHPAKYDGPSANYAPSKSSKEENPQDIPSRTASIASTRTAPVDRFLQHLLADGPKAKKHIIKQGRQHGFTLDQLRRAADRLHVVHSRQGFGPGSVVNWMISRTDRNDDEAE